MPAQSAAKTLDRCPYCEADHGEVALRCPATDMLLPLTGRLLAGKFRLLSELGRGGMGAVWLARNIHVDRDVAIKLILPEVLKNPEIVERFRDEARVAARIGHAGICDILDFELTPIGPVIVMELLRGESLGQRIAREGRLPAGTAVSMICQALVALEAAHRAGIIHRDLKPENLFLHQPDAAPMVVKLMDFGISKFTDRARNLTASGVIMGTPEYMAPEQISGAANADARTDLWAIGAVLYKAITGEDAFTGDSVPAVLIAIASGTPAPIESLVEGVPPGLSAVILRCLTREPDERYQSAKELVQALQPFAAIDREELGSLPTLHSISGVGPLPRTVPPVSAVWPTTPRRRSSWPLRVVGLGLLVAGVGAAWWFATQRPVVVTRGPDVIAAAPELATPPEPAGPTREAVAGGAESAGALAAWSVPIGARPDLGWMAAGLAEFADAVAQAPKIEPVVVAETAGEVAAPGTAGEVAAPGTAGELPAGEDGEPPEVAATAGEVEPVEDTKPPEVAETEVPRLISAGGYVTPSVAGKPGNQHWAKEYCGALDRNKYLGVDRWKLANPTEARLFAKVEGVKPGSYWTSANYRGMGKVVQLPRGSDRSMSSRKKTARPLCVAAQS
jgi:eukaryotic-like serine/threonine-protein kinase